MNMKTALILLLMCFLPSNVLAHGGRTDGYGCHNDRKSGGYHCHSGPLAGKSFSSKSEMLKTLESYNKQDNKEDKKK